MTGANTKEWPRLGWTLVVVVVCCGCGCGCGCCVLCVVGCWLLVVGCFGRRRSTRSHMSTTSERLPCTRVPSHL